MYGSGELTVIYELYKSNFNIKIYGKSENPDIFNLTSHSYFNLNKNKDSILKHHLFISDSRLQIIDRQFIPTEEYIDFKKESNFSEYDFSKLKEIRHSVDKNTSLSEICDYGIDLAYCFKKHDYKNKIEIWSDNYENGLKISSNQEACVIYTLNKITDEAVKLENGKNIKKYNGITFEMQRKPNYVHSEKTDILTGNYYSITNYEII